MSLSLTEVVVHVTGVLYLVHVLRRAPNNEIVERWGLFFAALFAALMLLPLYELFNLLRDSMVSPRTWDFPGFYLYGFTALAGKNVHSPDVLAEVLPLANIPVKLEPSFFKELVTVGCTYPTPSTLLFAPFALFDFDTAHALWISLIVISNITAVIFLWRWFAGGWRWPAILPIIGCMIVFLHETGQVYRYEQTDFVVMTLLALFLICRDQRAGYIAGIAIFVKPIMAITVLILLLEHRWDAVLRAVLVVIAGFVLAAVLIDLETVMTYFLDSPGKRIHIVQYKQAHAQSLLNVVLRLTDERNRILLSPLNPAYLSVSVAMLIPTTIVAWLLIRQNIDQLAYALLIAFAVAVYPGTLDHYGVFLFVPVLCFLLTFQGHFSRWLAALFAIIILFIMQQANHTFQVAIITWEAAIVCGIWMLVPQELKN